MPLKLKKQINHDEKNIFRFRQHPRDFLRGTKVTKLPNPEEDLDSFLLQFLSLYQTDDTVAYVNDLYKLYYDEFQDDVDLLKFIEYLGGEKTKSEIKNEINDVETDLKQRAYENFYQLILEDKIEIITDGKK